VGHLLEYITAILELPGWSAGGEAWPTPHPRPTAIPTATTQPGKLRTEENICGALLHMTSPHPFLLEETLPFASAPTAHLR